jgi:putative endonuclease
MASHNDLGNKGEDLAASYLLKHGYKIVTRNFRFQKAEVDIIARKDNILAVIEVKTRSNSNFGDPQEFLKGQQIQRLVKAVDHFVTENKMDVEVRFDIIAIIKNKTETQIEHLENAFIYFQ